MTSANQVDEPICIANREAIKRLKGIADYFLVHNRDILVRCDDSIAHGIGGKEKNAPTVEGICPEAYHPEKILSRNSCPGTADENDPLHFERDTCIL